MLETRLEKYWETVSWAKTKVESSVSNLAYMMEASKELMLDINLVELKDSNLEYSMDTTMEMNSD